MPAERRQRVEDRQRPGLAKLLLEKPPVSTAIVWMPARAAAWQSQMESPIITACSRPVLRIATSTRSGAGLVAATSAAVVQASASSRASRRSR